MRSLSLSLGSKSVGEGLSLDDVGSLSKQRKQRSGKAAKKELEEKRKMYLALQTLALVLEQGHGKLVALEQDGVGVLDVRRERRSEMVER